MTFETKEYLDIEGLKSYTSKILDLISKKADSSVVNAELIALKAIIGDVNQLGDKYKNLVVALLAEIERAKAAEEQLSNSFDWGRLG